MSVELVVPEVGESVTEVQIGRWLKNEGDAVDKDEPIVEIETDKVTLELPAPAPGRLGTIRRKQGDAATVGDVIGYLEDGAAEQASTKSSGGATEQTSAKPSRGATTEQASAKSSGGGVVASATTETDDSSDSDDADQKPAPKPASEAHVMPAARHLIEQHGLDVAAIEATGPGGRILKEDVLRYLEKHGEDAKSEAPATKKPREQEKPEAPPRQAPAAAPVTLAPLAGDREEQLVPMTPLRRKIAKSLVEAQQTAALLTTFNEIDMTNLLALRNRYKESFEQKHGVRLGFMSFFTKAVIDALRQYPALNAEVRGQDVIYKNYYDIGIAIGSGKGLVVPVLRDADRMSFAEIEKTIGAFADKARNNKLTLEDLTGGTFTITNGGVFGSLLSTPIVNPPQSGVLGMHAIQQRPVVVDDDIQVRSMMYVALTYDHRLVDGREAVTFLVRVKQAIEDPARMLMEV